VDIRKVGHDLNVRYVLEGSVQRYGEQIRITAQLIDASTSAHVWSDRWDRPVGDLFAVQTEISEQVTSRLLNTGGAITTAEYVANRRENPTNLTAYELYLRAREALHRFTKESVTEAIPQLLQAVEKDPTLARAWAELSAAYTVSIEFGADSEPTRAKAIAAAERAVSIDPMDALAHAHLAFSVGMTGDLKRSEAEWDTALRLNPSSADILAMYAGWANTFKTPAYGAEVVDRAIRLDPNYPSWEPDLSAMPTLWPNGTKTPFALSKSSLQKTTPCIPGSSAPPPTPCSANRTKPKSGWQKRCSSTQTVDRISDQLRYWHGRRR
jgi:Tfp pilus assembly protein PilF